MHQRYKSLALAAAVFLPILFILLFYWSNQKQNVFINPPQYDFLFAETEGCSCSLKVHNNRIEMKHYLGKNESPSKVHWPTIYRYHVNTHEVSKISYEKKSLEYDRSGQTVELLLLDDRAFILGYKAPDGYEYKMVTTSNIFTLINRHHAYHHFITNGSDRILFRSNTFYVSFLGWLPIKE